MEIEIIKSKTSKPRIFIQGHVYLLKYNGDDIFFIYTSQGRFLNLFNGYYLQKSEVKDLIMNVKTAELSW